MDYDLFSPEALAHVLFRNERRARSAPYIQTFAVYAVTKSGAVKLGDVPVTVEDGIFTFLLPSRGMLEIIKRTNRLNFYKNELLAPSFAVERFDFGDALAEDPKDSLRIQFTEYAAKDKAVAESLEKLMEIWEDEGA